MRVRPKFLGLTAAATAGFCAASIGWAGAPSDLAQLDFFEKKIRPVLVESCYECHSADSKKVKGGLLLDTREALLKGGDSGPAIVPGEPRKSLLIVGMRHDDPDPDMAMPPKKDKLPDQIIADFEEWVKMGAPDPRSGATAARTVSWDAAKAAEHWAFKPVTQPTVPNPIDTLHFVQSPVDAFVLAKLTEKKLAPATKADGHTLIRRVTYDLTGLPPTPEEVDAFLADQTPGAWEKVIDRLLASPHYGERWGRHWLDIARYADTSGDRVGGGKRQPLYPYAWTYRDYVINAFNQDLPYDQFIIEQIAADRLPKTQQDKAPLAALGFLTVGKRFLNNDNDVLDDRIDVVAKGLMGLTAACARCHDHKFDPIPTKDYYSLHGIFNSSEEPSEQPLLTDPEKNPAYSEFKTEVAKIEVDVTQFKQSMQARLVAGMIEKTGDYLLFTHESATTADGRKKGDNIRLAARERGLDPELAVVWVDRVKSLANNFKDPVFGPWLQFAALPDGAFAEKAPALAAEISENANVNPALEKELGSRVPESLKEVATIYTRVFKRLHEEMKLDAFVSLKGGKKSPFDFAKTQVALADSDAESLRKYLFGSNSPIAPDDKLMTRSLGNVFTNGENLIRGRVVNLELAHPGAPMRAMTLVDKTNPKDSAVLVRGEPGNRGAVVPRQFLSILSGPDRQPVTNGSGRLELAQAIARRDNPLTARVLVNRVWQWHFGEGIVRTVSDFGTRSEPPTHPELLDWLANWFMDQGWSIKKLHRLILTSNVYQQESRPSEPAVQSDPTNQWLSHFNLQRLDLEEIRDTLLTISGKLDTTVGGPPFNLGDATPSARKGGYGVPDLSALKTSPNRRTVYALIDRAALQEMFSTFDFANPDMSTGERILTTVPQQALFLMNSPFIVEQVKHLLARYDFPATGSREEKVNFLFRAAFQRAPRPAETGLALAFLSAETPPPDGDATGGGIKRIADTAAPDAPNGSEAANAEAMKTAVRKAQAAKTAALNPLSRFEQYAQVVLLTNELIFVN